MPDEADKDSSFEVNDQTESSIGRSIREFTKARFSRKIVQDARAVIWNGRSQPGSTEKEVAQEKTQQINGTLLDGARQLLGYNDTLLARLHTECDLDTVLAAVICNSSPSTDYQFGVEIKLTNEDIQRENKTRELKAIIKDKVAKLAQGNKEHKWDLEELERHLGLGSALLLVSAKHSEKINWADLEKYLYNSDEPDGILKIIKAAIAGKLVKVPPGEDVDYTCHKLKKLVGETNAQTQTSIKLKRRFHSEDATLIPRGSTEVAFQSLGISQENLHQTLEFLINASGTETKLFAILCLGIDFAQLPAKLRSWFEDKGVLELPCQLLPHPSTAVSFCVEIDNGILTDLEQKFGIQSVQRFTREDTIISSFLNPSTGVVSDLPSGDKSVAIIDPIMWWTSHSYLTATSYLVGRGKSGPILVPFQPGNDTVYVTARDALKNSFDNPNQTIGVSLPSLFQSHIPPIMGSYVDIIKHSNNPSGSDTSN